MDSCLAKTGRKPLSVNIGTSWQRFRFKCLNLKPTFSIQSFPDGGAIDYCNFLKQCDTLLWASWYLELQIRNDPTSISQFQPKSKQSPLQSIPECGDFG